MMGRKYEEIENRSAWRMLYEGDSMDFFPDSGTVKYGEEPDRVALCFLSEGAMRFGCRNFRGKDSASAGRSGNAR